ncbi:MAG: hypothetical protein WDO19_30400 [Bacteroidota bacterium]
MTRYITWGFRYVIPFALADDDPATYVPARDLFQHAGKYVTVLIYFITPQACTDKEW